MRILYPVIIEALVSAVVDLHLKLIKMGRHRALEFVGDHHPGSVARIPFSNRRKKIIAASLCYGGYYARGCRGRRPVHRRPATASGLLHLSSEIHLIQVPLIAGSRPTATQFVGRSSLSELRAPSADGLVGYPYASLGHQLLYIAVAQGESVKQPYAVADDLARETVASIEG